jgi:hypothetical protein
MAMPRQRQDAAVVVSLLVCFLGVVALLQGLGLGLSARVFWPALVGSGGVVLRWWQADETSRYAWLATSGGWKTWLRTLAGVLLLGAAISLAVFQSGVRGALGTALASLVLAVVGVALVVGPWLLRTNRALHYERAERVRTQETRGCRGAPARLGAPDAGADPATLGRPAGRDPACAHAGARASAMALRTGRP